MKEALPGLWVGVLLGLWGGLFLNWWLAGAMSPVTWRNVAVAHGCAIYDCNASTGDCEWKWKGETE